MDQLSQHSTRLVDLKKHYTNCFADIFGDADANDMHQEAVIEGFLLLLKIGFPIMLTAQNDTNSCESEFVRHLACPNCGSSDANSLYSDGHTFCFVCHHRTKGEGENHIHQTNMLQLIGEPARLISRKISQKTAEKFRTYSDGNVIRHYYYDTEGAICGAKVRTREKTFTTEGSVKTLFGMQNFSHKFKNPFSLTKEKTSTKMKGNLSLLKVRWTLCLSGKHNPIGM